MKLQKIGKIFLITSIIIGSIYGGLIALYIKGLPYIVSHPKTIDFAQDTVKKYTNADLKIENPALHTEFSPNIEFKVNKIYLSKNNTKILDLEKFDTKISFAEILTKKIIINKLVANSIFIDANGLTNLLPRNEQKNQESEWSFDIFNALLGVKNCEIFYSMNPDTKIHLIGHHIGVNNAEKEKRNVRFQLYADVSRKTNTVKLTLKDNSNVYFKDNLFHIENCPLGINKSNIFINLTADKKQNFDINLFSNNFNITDILDFFNTQIIENNIQDTLAYLSDIQGSIDFKLNIKKDSINGNFKLNSGKFKIKGVDNIPITLTKGQVDLTSKEIKIKDFEGYYDNNKKNKLDFEGSVKDYLKTVDINITGSAIARNDFFKTHLTKMTGTKFEIKGEAPTKITLKSKNNIMDFVWLFMLKPGQNIKIANDYLPFEDSLRFMKSDMHLENMVLDIKSLDYHMVPRDKILSREEYAKQRAEGKKFQPIFKLKSRVDLKRNNHINFINFEIPEPLPSEILNAILQQDLFKRGKISGKMNINNQGQYPVLNGTLNMERVIIPSQMTYIKEASLNAKDKLIHLDALGGYRRAKFSFNGDILNQIKFPVIVKDANLSLENIDTLKLLETFNNQNSADNVISTDEGIIKQENSTEEFDIRNIIVEKANFHLDKGSYKEIEFGNLDANLMLNKDGIIDVKSNRFDFAQGQSSLRANFDLINKKYNVKLGVRDVNSDIIANALLDLKKEITGKASGFLDLTTDDSMKLSGSIRFNVKDGQIEKIGLVEYVLKCASLLRNTLTMISPAIFTDIVNVPEGYFDKITGTITLKNNVATNINIKTYSPHLSNYIAGRYNIENGDTSLRIYTKFSDTRKGITGFLRKISLNSLANRIPINSRNDANYYAVELAELPEIDSDEKDCQIYLTKVEGDVVNNNYISSLKKIK